MTGHRGGEMVSGGVYWNKNAGEFVSVPADGGRLGGCEGDKYIRTPMPLVLILGPLMGAAFAFFLPISGVLMLVPFLAPKFRSAVAPCAARMAAPQLQPGVSYLEPAPHRGVAEHTEVAAGDAKLIRLAEAIAENRWREL